MPFPQDFKIPWSIACWLYSAGLAAQIMRLQQQNHSQSHQRHGNLYAADNSHVFLSKSHTGLAAGATPRTDVQV